MDPPSDASYSPRRMRFLTALIFFLSGFATLVYQVVWQRVLTQEIGVDFLSIAYIVTIFMLGLGFGALGGSRVAARHKRALPWIYVIIETVIGLFGLVSIQVIRQTNGLVAGLGLQSAFLDFLCNCVVLAPVIFLMGMTSPMIIEYVKTSLRRVGSIVGIFYGINVLGAAAGAVCTGIYFIELFGLQQTAQIAALTNLGIAGLFLVGQMAFGLRPAAEQPAGPPRPFVDMAGIPGRILVACCLFGFVTLAVEMILFRVVANYFSPWPPLFAFMLAVFLVMLAVGEFAGGFLVDRVRAAAIPVLLMVALVGTAVTSLVMLGVPLLHIFDVWRIDQFAVYNEPSKALLLIAAFMLPVLFISAYLPIVVKAATRSIDEVGATFGAVLFMFTVGNVFGSYITAVWLFETIGTLGSVIVTLAMSGLGVFLLVPPEARRIRISAGVVAVAVPLVAAVLMPWNYFYQSTGYLRAHFTSAGVMPPDVNPVDVFEDREAVTAVVPDRDIFHIRPFWGNAAMTDPRPLAGVNAWSLSPLLIADPEFRPRRILQIGVGGNQFPLVMREHEFVEKVTVVELTHAVLLAHRKYGNAEMADPLDGKDPRIEYVVSDGRRFVQKALTRGETFDFIQIGVNNLKQTGTNNIYSLEFLRKVKQLLSPTGYAAMFSYTGVARMGLEVWPRAFLFPNCQTWVFLTDRDLPPSGQTLEVPRRIARFYTANHLADLRQPLASDELGDLHVWIYTKNPFFDRYEISTDDNLSYEYWMLRTRRKADNNPEVYLWNQKDAPRDERVYRLTTSQ